MNININYYYKIISASAENFFSTFTSQQKTILKIASLALSFVAASYLLLCCFKKHRVVTGMQNIASGQQDFVIIRDRAEAFRKLGKFKEAEDEFKKALALLGNEQDPFTSTRYAETLYHLGKFKEAKAECQKILALPGGRQHLLTFPNLVLRLQGG